MTKINNYEWYRIIKGIESSIFLDCGLLDQDNYQYVCLPKTCQKRYIARIKSVE